MRYQLKIRCEVRQTDDHGGYYGQGLTVEETIDIGTVDFMETAAVLGRFHELGQELQAKQGAGERM
jgi:hypothetical protein